MSRASRDQILTRLERMHADLYFPCYIFRVNVIFFFFLSRINPDSPGGPVLSPRFIRPREHIAFTSRVKSSRERGEYRGWYSVQSVQKGEEVSSCKSFIASFGNVPRSKMVNFTLWIVDFWFLEMKLCRETFNVFVAVVVVWIISLGKCFSRMWWKLLSNFWQEEQLELLVKVSLFD